MHIHPLLVTTWRRLEILHLFVGVCVGSSRRRKQEEGEQECSGRKCVMDGRAGPGRDGGVIGALIMLEKECARCKDSVCEVEGVEWGCLGDGSVWGRSGQVFGKV